MKYNRDNLIEKLIAHEGLRLDVYQDTLGINTIGIGRNLDDRGISKDELDWMDYPTIEHVFSDGITEADAMYLAQNDVQIWASLVFVNSRRCGMLSTRINLT